MLVGGLSSETVVGTYVAATVILTGEVYDS